MVFVVINGKISFFFLMAEWYSIVYSALLKILSFLGFHSSTVILSWFLLQTFLHCLSLFKIN